MSENAITDEEIRQLPLRLRGHAKWLRNYAADPKRYHDPIPMVPDELDKIADMIVALNPRPTKSA